MLRHLLVWGISAMVVTLLGMDAAVQSHPEGQLVIAFDTTMASASVDPAETTGLAAPFRFLYALHDALVKPLPGRPIAPCLAESWTESPDGLVYAFTLRQGVQCHNTKLRPMERAAFLAAWREKKVQGLLLNASGALGNAATRIETFVIGMAPYADGEYPDLDDLFRQQEVAHQPGTREALLHQL